MSQNDYIIANDTAANVRADLNLALQALASTSSGATEPSTTYANMLWYDTANNILKMRSEADDAWIDLGTLDQSANTFTPAGVAELTQTQVEDDTSTVFGQVSGQRLAQAIAEFAGPPKAIQVFENSASWTRSAGVTRVVILATGGGGGSGNVESGGAGSTLIKWLDVSSISSATITIGAGGSGGAAASAGSDTTWSDGTNTLTAKGGLLSGSTGYGGVSTDGDINIPAGREVSFWGYHNESGASDPGAGYAWGAAPGGGSRSGNDGVVIVVEY